MVRQVDKELQLGFLSRLFGEKKPRVVPVSLDEANFDQEVLKHKGPCLVDVWTHACTHCAKLAPTIAALATKYKDQVKVCELDAGKSPALARRMEIRGTPTVVVFEDGKILGRVTGFRLQSYYEEMIETEFPAEGSETEQLS
ncbi:MAG: thioredoxin family protein [Candidatus Eisenbacteria bacterium]